MPADRGRAQTRRRRNPIEDGPRLFKRGRWWAADLRPWGGARPTLRDAKGERTEFRDVARQWAEGEVAKLQREKHDRQRGIAPKRTLGTLVEEYLEHRRATQERNTVANDVTATNHLLEAFGEKRAIHTIAEADVQGWFNQRAKKYAPGTLALFAINMRSFFQWAGREFSITTIEGHKADPDTLTDDEVTTLLEKCETDEEKRLCRVGLATGARRAELWALVWEDFRPDGRSVRFARQMAWPGRGTKGLKGKRNRTALVLPDLIEERGKGPVFVDVLTTDRVGKAFRAVLKQAGLFRVGRGLHLLRHTYSRIGMERYGWSMEMLRVFLGHENMRTTEIYSHFGEETAIKMATERTYGL